MYVCRTQIISVKTKKQNYQSKGRKEVIFQERSNKRIGKHFNQPKMQLHFIALMAYLPLKLSVTEDGLTEIGLALNIFKNYLYEICGVL